MQRGRLNITQNLRLESVHHHEAVVRAELMAPDGTPSSTTLCFDDAWAALAHSIQLDQWRREGRILTHVWGWGEGVLLDEEMLFRRAAEGEPCL